MVSSGDPAQRRRLGGRLRTWIARRWTKRGVLVLVLAVVVLVAAGAVGEPWRWLFVVDGSLFAGLGLAMVLKGEARWPRAFARAAGAYLAGFLVLVVAGTPLLQALAWPYLLVQAGVSCPLGLPCPLGR